MSQFFACVTMVTCGGGEKKTMTPPVGGESIVGKPELMQICVFIFMCFYMRELSRIEREREIATISSSGRRR